MKRDDTTNFVKCAVVCYNVGTIKYKGDNYE